MTVARVRSKLERRPSDFGIEFEDLLPGHSRGQFLITTDSPPLDGPSWPANARHHVNRLLHAGRGRSLFCVDRSRGMRAALGYSLRCHPTGPALLYALAINDAFIDDSVFCAALLKLYLHRFGSVLFSVGAVLFDVSGATEAYARAAFGFRRAPQHACVRPGGTLLVQDPPP